MVQREIKNKTKHYAIAAILSAIMLASTIYAVTIPTIPAAMYNPTGIAPLKNFVSNDDLNNYLQNYANINNDIVDFEPAEGVSYFRRPTWSTIAGVDEAATAITDGTYIYIANGNFYRSTSWCETQNYLCIISANPDNPKIIGKTAPLDMTIIGLYPSKDGNKLAVLGQNSNGISIYIYDVSNKAAPTLTRTVTISGESHYVNSHMIDNYLYMIVQKTSYTAINNQDFLPQISVNNISKKLDPTSIYYPENQPCYAISTIICLNILDDNEQPTNLTFFMGSADQGRGMYVSTNNLYITYPNTDGNTEIYRITLNNANLTFEAHSTIPGDITLDMDEYNNKLCVITTGSTQSQVDQTHLNLYILNMDFDIVSKLENFIHNKHSIKFIDNKAYFISFFGYGPTAPTIVVDLKKPDSIKTVSNLDLPFTSPNSHVQKYDDNHLIVLIDNANGATDAIEKRVIKLVLLDISNAKKPVEKATYIIDTGRIAWASVLESSFSSLYFNQQKQLLTVSVQSRTEHMTFFYTEYIFKLSPKDGFILQGEISHQPEGSDRRDKSSMIQRTLLIDNTIYTFSDSMMQLHRLDNLSLITQVKF